MSQNWQGSPIPPQGTIGPSQIAKVCPAKDKKKKTKITVGKNFLIFNFSFFIFICPRQELNLQSPRPKRGIVSIQLRGLASII